MTAFLIDGCFLFELRGSLFYFLFRLFEPELTVQPSFLSFAACTFVATCMFFNFMTRTTFIAKKRRKKVQLINFTSYVTCTNVLLSRNPWRSRGTWLYFLTWKCNNNFWRRILFHQLLFWKDICSTFIFCKRILNENKNSPWEK